MSSIIEIFLSRLNGVKARGNGKWIAKCPAHADKSPSFAVSQANDGKILIKCWAGCEASEILAAMGLKWSDLSPTKYDKKSDFPSFNTYEMFPLLVQEALILFQANKELINGNLLSEADFKRTQQAAKTVLKLNTEWKQGLPGQVFHGNQQRINEINQAKSFGMHS